MYFWRTMLFGSLEIYLLEKVICLFAGAFLVSISGSIIDFIKFLNQLLQMKGVVQAVWVQILETCQAGFDVLKSEFHLRQSYITVLYLKVTPHISSLQLLYINDSTRMQRISPLYETVEGFSHRSGVVSELPQTSPQEKPR